MAHKQEDNSNEPSENNSDMSMVEYRRQRNAIVLSRDEANARKPIDRKELYQMAADDLEEELTRQLSKQSHLSKFEAVSPSPEPKLDAELISSDDVEEMRRSSQNMTFEDLDVSDGKSPSKQQEDKSESSDEPPKKSGLLGLKKIK